MKNVVEIEIKVAERLYRFFCDHEAPLGEVKEALFQLTKIVAKIEENSQPTHSQKIEEEKSIQSN